MGEPYTPPRPVPKHETVLRPAVIPQNKPSIWLEWGSRDGKAFSPEYFCSKYLPVTHTTSGEKKRAPKSSDCLANHTTQHSAPKSDTMSVTRWMIYVLSRPPCQMSQLDGIEKCKW